MRDGIGRDQIFEAEQVLDQMRTHDRVGAAGLGATDVVEDPLEHFQQKSADAAGEVQHRHPLVVGEAVRDAMFKIIT